MQIKSLKLILVSIIIFLPIFYHLVLADETLATRLAGRILLQVESHGEAWYVNPADSKRYYLGRPEDAFLIMKKLGVGITDTDLEKIPFGLINADCFIDNNDTDGDCLSDNLETAIKTTIDNSDSDGDSFNDKTEMLSGYDPLAVGKKLPLDLNFTGVNKGKIFLQIQSHGEAWYVNPQDLKKYYLGTPLDAWNLMKKLGLGITTSSLNEILPGSIPAVVNIPAPINNLPPVIPPIATSSENSSAAAAFSAAANAIRAGNDEKALAYFTPEIKNRVEYSLNFFNNDSRLAFANLLTAAKESGGSGTEKSFSAKTYFDLGGYEINLKFTAEKQADNSWLIANL